jgi:hypothetical protein
MVYFVVESFRVGVKWWIFSHEEYGATILLN